MAVAVNTFFLAASFATLLHINPRTHQEGTRHVFARNKTHCCLYWPVNNAVSQGTSFFTTCSDMVYTNMYTGNSLTNTSWHTWLLLLIATISFVMSVRPSARLSAWNNSAPIGRIFMKFDIWLCFENLSWKFKFHYNRPKIKGLYMKKTRLFFYHISLNYFHNGNVHTKVVEKN